MANQQLRMELTAFIYGYTLGELNGEPLSYREIETLFPDWSEGQIRACGNGSDDGAIGDDWRANRILKRISQVEQHNAEAQAPQQGWAWLVNNPK